MYIGIGPESKKRVLEEDAFSYACDRIYSGCNADLPGSRELPSCGA